MIVLSKLLWVIWTTAVCYVCPAEIPYPERRISVEWSIPTRIYRFRQEDVIRLDIVVDDDLIALEPGPKVELES